MKIQIFSLLGRPIPALSTFVISVIFGLVFLYFDEFYFVQPYFVVLISAERLPIFALDIAVSVLSGLVLTISVHEMGSLRSRGGVYRKTGFAGIIAALLAGACPCYYLVPLLAVSGGVGGALGTLGVLFYDYQFPIKLGSLALLLFTMFTLERSLKAACTIPVPS